MGLKLLEKVKNILEYLVSYPDEYIFNYCMLQLVYKYYVSLRQSLPLKVQPLIKEVKLCPINCLSLSSSDMNVRKNSISSATLLGCCPIHSGGGFDPETKKYGINIALEPYVYLIWHVEEPQRSYTLP